MRIELPVAILNVEEAKRILALMNSRHLFNSLDAGILDKLVEAIQTQEYCEHMYKDYKKREKP